MIIKRPNIAILSIINRALLQARSDVAEAQIQYDNGAPDPMRTFCFENVKDAMKEVEKCLAWVENMNVWAAEYLYCKYESDWKVISLHHSKRQAEKALQAHRLKEYQWWKECQKEKIKFELEYVKETEEGALSWDVPVFEEFSGWRLKQYPILDKITED